MMMWGKLTRQLRSFLILAFLVCLVAPSFFVFPVQINNAVPKEVKQQFSTGFEEVYGSGSKPTTVGSVGPSWLAPKLLITPNWYIYRTNWGNYSFLKKALYLAQYTDRFGTQMISNSTFWVASEKTILLFPFNATLLLLTDTTFSVTVEVRYGPQVVAYLTQTWDFSRVDKPKITVRFDKTGSWSQGWFEVFWLISSYQYAKLSPTSTISVKTSEAWAGNLTKVELGPTPASDSWGRHLLVDWSDKGVSRFSTGTISLSGVFNVKGVIVRFPRNDGLIDPSTVGTSTDSYATGFSWQRKPFLAATRHWVWGVDGTNFGYWTSLDGVTFGSFTAVRACTSGLECAVWNGTYVHYAVVSTNIYYRKGTPNSDGTITWLAAEQTAVSAGGDTLSKPNIAVDSAGYVWITFRKDTGFGLKPWVTKSGANDGTWGTTPTGFPYLLLDAANWWGIIPVPLTNQRMLVLYNVATDLVRAQSWSGSAWGAEVATDIATLEFYFSAVAVGDDVHLVFLYKPSPSNYNIEYSKYTYATNSFSSTVLVQSSVTITSAPVLTLISTSNDLIVFWCGSPTANHIYYKKCVSGVWDASATDWITETEILTENDRLNCFYQGTTIIGVSYMTQTGSPYNIRYAALSPNTAPTNDALTLDLTGASFKGVKTLLCGKQDYKIVYLCSDAEGVTDISYAQIALDPSGKNVILRATRGTGDAWTFAEQSDPSNYVTLNVGACTHSTSGNQKTFNFYLAVNWVWGDSGETVTVRGYVIDFGSLSDQDDYANVFGVEAHLAIQTPSVSLTALPPGATFTVSGSIFFYGTSIAPSDGNFNVTCILNSTVKASDLTLMSGAYSMSVTAELVLGSYTTYRLECTYMQASVALPTITVVSISLESLSVSATSGTAALHFNVTVRWSNGTLVQGATVTAYTGSLAGSAVSASNGLAQVTLSSVLHGSGILTINGTKSIWSISALTVTYSVSVSGGSFASCPSDWNVGEAKTVTVSFTNAAQVNVTKILLKTVKLRFQLLSGSSILFHLDTSTFDVDANSVKSLSQSLSLTGVQDAGTYVLRCLVVQVGTSEYTLATVDRSVYVMPLGSIHSFNPSPRLVLPILQPLTLKQGESRTISARVQLSQVSSATFLASTVSGVPSGWVTVSSPTVISLASPADVEVTIAIPMDAAVGSYTVTVPLSASASSGTTREALMFDVAVQAAAPQSSSSPMSVLSGLFAAFQVSLPVILVVVVLMVVIVCVLAVVLSPKRSNRPSRRYWQ